MEGPEPKTRNLEDIKQYGLFQAVNGYHSDKSTGDHKPINVFK